MFKRFIIGLVCYSLFSSCFAKIPTVAFFAKNDTPFMQKSIQLMQVAAANLGIQLDVYQSDGSHLALLKQVHAITQSTNKPDAILFSEYKHTGTAVLKFIEQAKIPTFIFNAPVDQKLVGLPRERYRYWIGQMIPDDATAAKDMAGLLIKKAKDKNLQDADGKVHVLAITGLRSDSASDRRTRAMQHAMSDIKDAVLHIIGTTDWTKKRAAEQFNKQRSQFPQSTVTWSAGSEISEGVLEAMELSKIEAGKDMLINSHDFELRDLDKIKSGKLVGSTVGHLTEGAFSLVLVYDYLAGKDFADQQTTWQTPMTLITQENVDEYLPLASQEKFDAKNLAKLDFKRFSKVHNKQLKKYKFDLHYILEQL